MTHFTGVALTSSGNISGSGCKKGDYEEVTAWAEKMLATANITEVLICEIKEVARRREPAIMIEDYHVPEEKPAATLKGVKPFVGNGEPIHKDY